MVADPSLGQVADALIGQVLGGRYNVTSRIARGGMGTVYAARDIKLGRDIAIKVMHPEAARDDQFVARFVGEAKAAAALSHPNVVAVYDQGFSDGHVYLVMEYVKGRTLRDLLTERGRLDPRSALSLMQPILSALGAAHRAGLVHRDVKPENVLLTDDGNVKVADFGLARAATASRQTKTGLIIGTVAYMAPEQVVAGTADARSDVYAAGIMLYELVTGAQPYQGDTPLAVAYKHVNEIVPPPSRAVPGIPPHVDALVAAATAPDPTRRPANADQFLAALTGGVRTPAPAPAPAPPQPPAHNATAVMQMPQFPSGGSAYAAQTVGVQRRDRGEESPLFNRILSAVTGRFVLIGIGVVAVAVLAWAIWFQTSGQYQAVPSVIGHSVADAEAELTGKGYKVVQGPSRFSDKIAKDAVVDMRPSPGSQVTSGSVITLFASRGMQPVAIPDLKGKSLADAQNTLQSLGLHFTSASEASKSVAPGAVIRTVPGAGQMAQPGIDTVTIYSSNGVQVPNVVGQSQEQAKQALQAAGFQVQINEQDPAAGQQPDTVLSQSPQQGGSAAPGSLITLTATKHPASPPPSPQPGQPGAVPSVIGMPFAQALATLQAAGLQVKHPDHPFDGPVTGQNPAPGSQVPPGTQVDIWSGQQQGNG